MAAQFNENLKVCYFNCTGVKNSMDYLKDLLDKSKDHIICLQETWLLNCNLNKLGSIHKDYCFTGKSGVESDEDIIGRPKGGVVILWRRDITQNVTVVKTLSKRICALTLKLSLTSLLLIICIYMPVDTRCVNQQSDDFLNELDHIEQLIQKTACNNFIICGDWNTSFERNNSQTHSLLHFMDLNKLYCTWGHPNATKANTYVNHSLGHYSCIDHFIVSHGIYSTISSCWVEEDSLNPSNHNPIHLSIFDRICTNQEYLPDNHELNNSILWDKVTQDDVNLYQKLVLSGLEHIDIYNDTVACDNINCTNVNHCDCIDHLCNGIINTCTEAGKLAFPVQNKHKKKLIIPNWKDKFKPLRDKSVFWHHIWQDCGKPQIGPVTDIMKYTRCKYHAAVKNARKMAIWAKNRSLAETLSRNNYKDFWARVKKMSKPKIHQII